MTISHLQRRAWFRKEMREAAKYYPTARWQPMFFANDIRRTAHLAAYNRHRDEARRIARDAGWLRGWYVRLRRLPIEWEHVPETPKNIHRGRIPEEWRGYIKGWSQYFEVRRKGKKYVLRLINHAYSKGYRKFESYEGKTLEEVQQHAQRCMPHEEVGVLCKR